ncbi:MAG TPA: acyltransferase [Novosphingobium sp.]|nr:acyltransferase [Novosphingobium sp.]
MRLSPSGGKTLEEQLRLAGGRPSGFDYIRIVLALTVVVWHSVVTSYGLGFQDQLLLGPARIVFASMVPMFFAVSGFLVSASLSRTHSIFAFLSLRAIRLIPPLLVASAVTALAVGPLFTITPLGNYFADGHVAAYFLNAFGIIRDHLPGVFLNNPLPNIISGQLWTIPYEMGCYLAIALLSLVGLLRNRRLFLLVVISLQLAFLGRALLGGPIVETTVPSRTLILCFLAGAALYRYRDKVPHSPAMAVAAGTLHVALLLIPRGSYLLALPASYLVIYAGLLTPRRTWVVTSGDYSYGIFLYGFAIQQAMMALFPWARAWYWNLALSVPPICIAAYASWHVVEKHALQLRHVVRRMEERWLAFRDAQLPSWMKLGAGALADTLPVRQ